MGRSGAELYRACVSRQAAEISATELSKPGRHVTMHTFLSLSSVDCQSDVERQVSALTERLKAACDSIDACHISVEQPSNEAGERYWRIVLMIRVFDENARVTTRRQSDPTPAQSLACALADTYERGTAQMAQVARRHNGHCCVPDPGIAVDSKRCA
jgi:hypothetical protein